MSVQDLQSHPCFAAVVQHKWNTKWQYKCIHWLVRNAKESRMNCANRAGIVLLFLESRQKYAAIIVHSSREPHVWEYKFVFSFRLLMVFIYLPFMASLMTALVLAARSGHPLQYCGIEGVVQGICEAISFLYILLWLGTTILLWYIIARVATCT